MKASLLVVALPLLAVLAGCITDEGSDPGTTVDACFSPFDAEGIAYNETTDDPIQGMNLTNRFDFETTNKRTCSLPAIGRSALHPDGTPHKYIGEIDMRGDLDLGAVAVLGNSEDPRVYLVDISSRAEPTVLSFIDQVGTYIVDVKISDDGRYLFTASQALPLPPGADPEDPQGSATGVIDYGAEQVSWASADPAGMTGFTIYDISDPADPQYVLFHPDPQVGCHMMSHEFVGDTELLFCVSQQVRAYQLSRTTGDIAVTGFVDYVPQGEQGLPGLSQPPVSDQGTGLFGALPFTSGPHDMTVTKDAKDGKTYAVVSHWNHGVRVVDVTGYPNMVEVGSWTGEGATHYDGNVHTAMMFYVGDDRYIMASPEYTYAGPVPSLWVLDANDLSDLKLVGEWYHPGEHDALGLYLTTHQWQVAPTGLDATVNETQVYLTYNHAGIWVLDFQAMLEKDLQGAILGYNIAREELDPDTAIGNAVLATWDVNLVDGYIYGSDRATGLWVFHHEDDPLGDPRYTGFA